VQLLLAEHFLDAQLFKPHSSDPFIAASVQDMVPSERDLVEEGRPVSLRGALEEIKTANEEERRAGGEVRNPRVPRRDDRRRGPQQRPSRAHNPPEC
jgi:hypothetical protein